MCQNQPNTHERDNGFSRPSRGGRRKQKKIDVIYGHRPNFKRFTDRPQSTLITIHCVPTDNRNSNIVLDLGCDSENRYSQPNPLNDNSHNNYVTPNSAGHTSVTPTATETDTVRKQSFMNAKTTMKIGTWNVRTMNPSNEKLPNAIREMKQYGLQVLGLCETRWINKDKFEQDGCTVLYSGGDQRMHGVGMILNDKAKRAYLSWNPISNRIMTARFQGSLTKITIVQAYAPTNTSEPIQKDEFYELLQQTINEIPKHDIIFLMGDMNAKLSEDRKGYENTIGPFGSASERNDNGQRFIDLCTENEFKIMNTFFKHKFKVTWTSNDGITQSELDYVCVKKRWSSAIQDVRIFRSADIGSDHELVVATVKLKLKKNAPKTISERPFDIQKLKNEESKQNFQASVEEKIRASKINDKDVDEKWNTMKVIMKESAEETIGRKRGSKRENWISDETWKLIDERKEAKAAMIQNKNETTVVKYKDLDKLVKRQTRRDKAKWFDANAAEAEKAASVNDTRTVYKIIKGLTNKPTNSHVPIKDKEGKTLNTDEEIENRWVEHFSSVLNQPCPLEELNVEQVIPALQIDVTSISKYEISKALSALKNNKAPGTDQIHPEMLKTGGDALLELLLSLCNSVWETGLIPEEWKTGTIIPLPKKGNLSECSNWRGITLLSIPYKVMCIVLLNRMKEAVDDILRDEQSGFRPKRSCTDAIFALKYIIEKTVAHQIPVFLHFIDFQKAFDSVHRDTMWKILVCYGIPSKIVGLLKEMYNGTQCSIKIGKSVTKTFDIKTGVRQGCILSPFLFTIVIDYLLRQQDNCNKGINIMDRYIFDLDFADDIVLIETSNNRLQENTDQLRSCAEKIGLRFNCKKCETMATLDEVANIQILQEIVKTTETFTYLGSKINNTGSSSEEIRSRVGKAGAAFGQLRPIMKAKNISLKTKLALYNSLVLSILLYSSETWTIYAKESKSLDAFHQRCLRQILGITYKDRVRNIDVLGKTGYRPLSFIIQERRLRWLGHVCRMANNRFPRHVVNWEPNGKRRRGRPRLSWHEMVSNDLKTIGMSLPEAMRTAQDRGTWRTVTALCVSSARRT